MGSWIQPVTYLVRSRWGRPWWFFEMNALARTSRRSCCRPRNAPNRPCTAVAGTFFDSESKTFGSWRETRRTGRASSGRWRWGRRQNEVQSSSASEMASLRFTGASRPCPVLFLQEAIEDGVGSLELRVRENVYGHGHRKPALNRCFSGHIRTTAVQGTTFRPDVQEIAFQDFSELFRRQC